jgi:hypothetical protein
MTDQPEDKEDEKREDTKPIPVPSPSTPPTEAIILKSSD